MLNGFKDYNKVKIFIETEKMSFLNVKLILQTNIALRFDSQST